jgi:hypothetical protein
MESRTRIGIRTMPTTRYCTYTHRTSSYITSSYKMSSYQTSIYQTSSYRTSRLANVLFTKRSGMLGWVRSGQVGTYLTRFNLSSVLYPQSPFIPTFHCITTDSLQVCSNLTSLRMYPPLHGYEKPPGTEVPGKTQISSRKKLVLKF